MTLLITIVSFVVSLGILIFVHELGHFLLAKRAGVRVEKFSLGFGPKIFGFRPEGSDTEYVISALPLGGFVKMTGENPEDDGEEETSDPRAFCNKSVKDRALIAAAGPVMNLLLPFLLMPVVYLMGIERPAYQDTKPVVGWVDPEGAAAAAGVEAGDLITELNGHSMERWKRVEAYIGINPGTPVDVTVLRADGHHRFTITPTPTGSSGMGYIGIYPPMAPVVAGVSEGFPAAEAGLQEGDQIVAIEGKPVDHWMQISSASHANAGTPLRFTIERAGKRFDATITPQENAEAGGGLIGVLMPSDTRLKKLGLIDAVREGWGDVVYFVQLTLQVIVKLFSLELPLKTLGGPVMIAKVTGQAAQVGIPQLLFLMGLLSVNLGILNLLPLPVLDGGHLFFLAIEALRRGKPVSLRIRAMANNVGIVLLVGFMVVVTFYDVAKIFGG
ncbi:MAG: RIP metalloprotease RseP [Myxococcales bacterium]|nr:RIP metalloprotease RseP [Myxococcales bacterium]